MDHSGGNLTKHRKNIAVLWLLIAIAVLGLLGRLVFSYDLPVGALQPDGP